MYKTSLILALIAGVVGGVISWSVGAAIGYALAIVAPGWIVNLLFKNIDLAGPHSIGLPVIGILCGAGFLIGALIMVMATISPWAQWHEITNWTQVCWAGVGAIISILLTYAVRRINDEEGGWYE